MPILNDKFLKQSDITEGDLIKILDEGIWTESRKFTYEDGSPKQQFNITIELGDGSTRTMSMNGMSRENLKQKWGKNTADWVGKLAVVHFEDCLVGGKKQKIIVLQPE